MTTDVYLCADLDDSSSREVRDTLYVVLSHRSIAIAQASHTDKRLLPCEIQHNVVYCIVFSLLIYLFISGARPGMSRL